MKIKKINPIEDADINITGATLLSREEAESLLTPEELVYSELWWLRTPGRNNSYGYYVDKFSHHIIDGCPVSGNLYVRPALIIDISKSNIKVGDIFEFGGKEFKILSPKLAWMYNNDIGNHSFKTPTEFEDIDYWPIYPADANVYEKSDIKKFVDDWFNETLKKGM